MVRLSARQLMTGRALGKRMLDGRRAPITKKRKYSGETGQRRGEGSAVDEGHRDERHGQQQRLGMEA